MLSSTTLRATRRGTLGGVGVGALVAGTGLSGCDRVTGSGTRSRTRAIDDDRGDRGVDAGLVDQAVATTREALALLAATGQAHPGLAGAVAGLRVMHEEHLAFLVRGEDEATAGPLAAPEVAARAGRALRAVRRSENDHQRLLGELAVEARSGALARLLASMAAAVGQRLALLPRDAGGPA